MKKSPSNNLLLPWLIRALDDELYDGLRWVDKRKRVFYVHWTHKSSEQWSDSEIEVCRAWAEHKGKLHEKNEKQLKATFRCALNSKKELTVVHKTKRRRYWQFIDPEMSETSETGNKKKDKKCQQVVENLRTCENSLESFTLAECLTSTEDSFNDRAENPSRLPPIETFLRFVPLTPPYQSDEILFYSTDYTTQSSPPPEHHRLTPPSESMDYQYSSFQNNFLQPSTDVWQPNFMTIPQNLQDSSIFSKFPNDNPFCDSTILDFSEMEQFVPELDTVEHRPVLNRQYSFTNKSVCKSNPCDSFEEDFLLDPNIDPIECQRLIQELDRLTPTSDMGTGIDGS